MDQQQELMNMINVAYETTQDPKFDAFKKQLLQLSQDLKSGKNYTKVMCELRVALLHADGSLNLKQRISGLPDEYSAMYYFIEPRLKNVDSKLLDRYMHYGFVPLKFGSTIKYP
ncbi:hypothetical protein [uncultured Secundilactobacillus sp.]|uniref:hypothetical protein n=1 Tax=uncultured Secundilactobacillus sp. TaxID=2813935 RepID=UPI00258432CB|nr:hypothetical protein [uncultured Secundilactobacillus sp.]